MAFAQHRGLGHLDRAGERVGQRLQPAFGIPRLGQIVEMLLGRLDLLGGRQIEVMGMGGS